jgi:lysophospholipase L1-like esterase
MYKFTPNRLVSVRNVPSAGSSIEIKCTSLKWSEDDTHPNPEGAKVYGKAIIEEMPQLLNKIGE